MNGDPGEEADTERGDWSLADWHSEIVQQYFGPRGTDGGRSVNTEDVELRIDPIDPTLVAKVKVGLLLEAVKELSWARDNLRYVQPVGPNVRYPVAATPRERDDKEKRTGVPSSAVIKPVFQDVVIHLMEKSELYETIGPASVNVPHAHAAVFLVEKAGKTVEVRGEDKTMLRMITDARKANAVCSDPSSFSMFLLDALLQTVSNVMHAAKDSSYRSWYAISADLRHWFHQIPLPRHLQQLFKIDLGHGDVVAPRAVPMGWNLAPLIAQTATWAMLIGREGNERPKFVDPAHYTSAMPPWLPFTEGRGGIFVLIDNVFVVTQSLAIAKEYARRLGNMADKLKIQFKGSATPEIITLQEGSDAHVDFTGIRFSYDTWRTIGKETKVLLAVPQVHTRRQVSSLLGEVLWDLRVRCVLVLYATDLMSLYSVVAPKTVKDWDSVVYLTPEQREILQRYVDEARKHHTTTPRPRWELTTVATYAVDACLDEKRKQIGVVHMRNGAWFKDTHTYDYIGTAELYAIVRAVEHAVKQPEGQPSAIIIATDSLCAKGWMERRYSQREDARALLMRLDRCLDATRIACVYVKSAENVADLPSRTDLANDAEGVVCAVTKGQTETPMSSAFGQQPQAGAVIVPQFGSDGAVSSNAPTTAAGSPRESADANVTVGMFAQFQTTMYASQLHLQESMKSYCTSVPALKQQTHEQTARNNLAKLIGIPGAPMLNRELVKVVNPQTSKFLKSCFRRLMDEWLEHLEHHDPVAHEVFERFAKAPESYANSDSALAADPMLRVVQWQRLVFVAAVHTIMDDIRTTRLAEDESLEAVCLHALEHQLPPLTSQFGETRGSGYDTKKWSQSTSQESGQPQVLRPSQIPTLGSATSIGGQRLGPLSWSYIIGRSNPDQAPALAAAAVAAAPRHQQPAHQRAPPPQFYAPPATQALPSILGAAPPQPQPPSYEQHQQHQHHQPHKSNRNAKRREFHKHMKQAKKEMGGGFHKRTEVKK